MTEGNGQISRRGFVSAGATLLAGFGLSATTSAGRARAATADPAAPPAAGSGAATGTDLALYRPVAVSSTDYAPTPAWFAVDGLAEIGVKGCGWRAAQGDPQWITRRPAGAVPHRVGRAHLRGDADDPTFVAERLRPARPHHRFRGALGRAVAFTVDVSDDGEPWTTVHRPLPAPAAS